MNIAARVGFSVALSALLVAGSAAAHGKKTAPAPAKGEFFPHCPLLVAHPSVTLVRGKVRWANMLKNARVSPPPFADQSLDFREQHIAIVALPQTPTPQTTAALDAAQPYTFHRRSGRLTLRLLIKEEPPAPGEIRATVVGEPCLVVWLPALRGVREVVAHDVDGNVISQRVVAAVY
jgi:hypothetical protein